MGVSDEVWRSCVEAQIRKTAEVQWKFTERVMELDSRLGRLERGERESPVEPPCLWPDGEATNIADALKGLAMRIVRLGSYVKACR